MVVPEEACWQQAIVFFVILTKELDDVGLSRKTGLGSMICE
jgi:hypothetical protein